MFRTWKKALFIGEIVQRRSAWMRKGEGEHGQPPLPWFHFILVSRHRRGRNWNRVRYDSTTLFPLPPTSGSKSPLCPLLGVLSIFQHKWGAGVNKESEEVEKWNKRKKNVSILVLFSSKISWNSFTWKGLGQVGKKAEIRTAFKVHGQAAKWES